MSIEFEQTSAVPELEARLRQQAAVAQLSQHALKSSDLQSLMDEAVTLIAQTLEVEYCKIVELLSDEQTFRLRAGVGWPASMTGHLTFSVDQASQAGYTLLASDTVIVTDLATETRFNHPALLPDHGIASGVSVLIPGRHRPFGVLAAHTTRKRTFTQDDTSFLHAMTNVLATAYERIRSETALQESDRRFRALLESAPVAIVLVNAEGKIVLVNAKTETLFGYHRRELIGQSIEVLLPQRFRDVHQHHRDGYFAEPRDRAMGLGLDLAGQHKDGTEFPVEVGLGHVKVDGQTLAMSFITDITSRKMAEEALHRHASNLEERVAARTREIERRQQVAEGLHDILTILNTNRPLEEILDHIVAQASRLLATDAVAVYQLDESDGSLRIQAARGLDLHTDAQKEISVGQGAVGRAVQERQPVTVPEISAQMETPDRAALEAALRYRAILAVPLTVKGEVYGSISLYYNTSRTFTQEEKELAVAFADQAALAIENARLREQVERSAVAAERSRLARDLHDAVTQTLFSTSLIAEVLPRLWERDPEEGKRRIQELRELSRGALAEMRTLLLELRPSALTEASLGDLLRQLAEAINSRARLPVAVEVEQDEKLPPDAQLAFYRIAQEALNNVAKHSGATQARVWLQQTKEGVALEIVDNGRGFDTTVKAPTHLGLNIMQERAESIGADLTIASKPGAGTEIRVHWDQQQNQPERPPH